MVTHQFKIHLWSLILLLFFLLQANSIFARVTATTTRTVLSVDETIVLEIKSDGSSDTPDLSPLEKYFQILGQNQTQNYSLINGNASRTLTWNITLLPKQTGELTIPPIKVGNESTQPIHLVIQKQSTNPGVDGKEVYLNIELDGKSKGTDLQEEHYYVQQQIIITIQLFHRIRFSNATLSELEIENTVIEKLGNDANYSKTIGKNRYNVIERRYAIYPQQSGLLTIPALIFNGNAEISQSFSLFSRPGRQIISRTKPITLNILPIPDNFTGKNWLPAESIEIESTILEDTKNIIAGEAITRHIIIRAKGLLGSQLPAISMPSSKSIKTYPDKEKLNNQIVKGQVIGVRRDSIAIIPLKAGEFTLPEISIDWWNTKTNQQETTRLAARTLMAQPNSDQSVQMPPVKQKQTAVTADTLSKDDKKEAQIVEKIVYQKPPVTKNLWFWISIILVILWLLTLALLVISMSGKTRPQKNSVSPENRKTYELEAEHCLQQFYHACQNNDAHQASDLLIQWAKIHFKQAMIPGLTAVTELLDDDSLNNAINHLESCQYSQQKENWQGEKLAAALKQFLHKITLDKATERNKAPQALSSLNP